MEVKEIVLYSIIILSYVLARLYFYKINKINKKYIWLFLIIEPYLVVLSTDLLDYMTEKIWYYLTLYQIVDNPTGYPLWYYMYIFYNDFLYLYGFLDFVIQLLLCLGLIYLLEKLKQKLYGYDKKYILIGIVSYFLALVFVLIVLLLVGGVLHLLGFRPS